MHSRIALALLVLAACGGSGVSDEPVPPVEEVLSESNAAMSALTSAGFEMSVSGAPIEITGLEFVDAEGTYLAPNRGEAVLRLRINDITIGVGTVSVGDRTWVTDPLTGEWSELERGVGFNPALLFGDEGWTALLSGSLADPVVHGVERDRYVVTGVAPAERVARLTAGVVMGQAVEIEFGIDTGSFLVEMAEFTTTSPDGDTEWVIRLGRFDEPADIEPPLP
ncbi:MAG TPA: LppX_LprAFG lipoprotein [Acidimicrobiia bacterium]|nr:LppX_LprAFG lipoprotein [Acidimicrobiia bacterium]